MLTVQHKDINDEKADHDELWEVMLWLHPISAHRLKGSHKESLGRS